jgi:beta-glucosidase
MPSSTSFSSDGPNETTSLRTAAEEDERERGGLLRRERIGRCIALGLLVSSIVSSAVFLATSSNDRPGDSSDSTDNVTPANIAFPPDFVWGSATSSYQVEGAVDRDGRGASIWDTYCRHGGRVLENATGDVACDHYHLYEKDVQLMKDLQLRAYRFSISWSRILPDGYADGDGNRINRAGIDFYNRLIDALLDHGIEPWVTLYHWDLPQTLEDDVGGWLDPGGNTIAKAFGDYARICYSAFGDRVKRWITLNEPWTVAVHGYNDGVKAPGRRHNGTFETYIVAHNLLLAHSAAAFIYKREFAPRQGGMVGMSNSADFRYPLVPGSELDQKAAERAMMFQFGWFLDPVITGDYPAVMRERLGGRLPRFTREQSWRLLESCDFLGINTYSSALVSTPEKDPTWGGYWADMFVTTSADPSWGKNFMGWPIVPDATRELLLWISRRYSYPLLFITENGTAEEENDLQTAQHDIGRRLYFKGHLRACRQAIQEGARLGGYFAWSLMDNFEWEYGYQRRFGICHVDFKTQVRTPKSSAIWYSQTIQTNGANFE